jgi:hypothetical protein
MTTVSLAGGEDTSYASLINVATSTSGGTFRSAFARSAMQMNGENTSAYPPVNFGVLRPFLSPLTSFWAHARLFNNGQAIGTGHVFAVLLDSSGLPRLYLAGTATTGQFTISTRTTAGVNTIIATSTAGAIPTTASGAPVAIDWFVNYSTSGQAAVYVNGVNVCDTGAGVNVTTNSVTTLNQLELACYSTSTVWWSEVLVQDTSTLGCSVQTLPPVASGNTQSWTPNTVGNVNEVTINDLNFIAAASVNELSEWTVGATLPAGAWTIEAVVQEARVSVGSTGPQHFTWDVRTSAGTSHQTGSVAPNVGSFANFGPQVWPTNPDTGVAWTAGQLVNAGIESLT